MHNARNITQLDILHSGVFMIFTVLLILTLSISSLFSMENSVVVPHKIPQDIFNLCNTSNIDPATRLVSPFPCMGEIAPSNSTTNPTQRSTRKAPRRARTADPLATIPGYFSGTFNNPTSLTSIMCTHYGCFVSAKTQQELDAHKKSHTRFACLLHNCLSKYVEKWSIREHLGRPPHNLSETTAGAIYRITMKHYKQSNPLTKEEALSEINKVLSKPE